MSDPAAVLGVDQPYPGLRPFTKAERPIFFGRDEQVDELLARLAGSPSRFLAVVGVSGCGKSSLVRAGLIPALEAGYLDSAGAGWRVATMRPGSRPFRSLAEALVADGVLPGADHPEAIAFLQATLRRGPLGLADALRESRPERGDNVLLIVDQFEEIFRFREGDRDEADAFVALLLGSAAEAEWPVYVVLAMRSEYLGECALFTGLPEAINDHQFLTPRLTRQQRREAIEGPAHIFDARVEPALVNRLLNDMGANPDRLPLMQHVLRLVWNRAVAAASEGDEIVLKEDDYGKPIGPPLRLTGLEPGYFGVLSVSPAGDRAAVVGTDGIVRAWDLKSHGSGPVPLRAGSIYQVASPVQTAVFGGDDSIGGTGSAGGSRWLTSFGYDGAARRWTLPPGELLAAAERAVGRSLTRGEWEQSLIDKRYERIFPSLPEYSSSLPIAGTLVVSTPFSDLLPSTPSALQAATGPVYPGGAPAYGNPPVPPPAPVQATPSVSLLLIPFRSQAGAMSVINRTFRPTPSPPLFLQIAPSAVAP